MLYIAKYIYIKTDYNVFYILLQITNVVVLRFTHIRFQVGVSAHARKPLQLWSVLEGWNLFHNSFHNLSIFFPTSFLYTVSATIMTTVGTLTDLLLYCTLFMSVTECYRKKRVNHTVLVISSFYIYISDFQDYNAIMHTIYQWD